MTKQIPDDSDETYFRSLFEIDDLRIRVGPEPPTESQLRGWERADQRQLRKEERVGERLCEWLFERRLYVLVFFVSVVLMTLFFFAQYQVEVILGAFVVAFLCSLLFIVSGGGDIWAAERAKKDDEKARRHFKKREMRLDKNSESLKSSIKRQIDHGTPVESVLTSIETRDYEVLARAVSTIDSIKDTEKGVLFKNMDTDLIFHVLSRLTEVEQIVILRQIDRSRREDILMRYPLSKRARLISAL